MAQLSVGGGAVLGVERIAGVHRFSPDAIEGATGRLLLVVDDPESLVAHAVAMGRADEPVGVEHGWLLGRLADPFGHEWEVGRPLIKRPPPKG